MNRVPDDLAATIRRAAATVPPHAGDLDTVLRRHQAARRRRRVAATATTAAALAVALIATAVGAGPSLLDRPGQPADSIPHVAASPASSMPAEPAQRLLLSNAGWSKKSGRTGLEVGIVPPAGVSEVLADESMVNHPVPGLDSWDQAVGLPDGRLVVLGPQDTMPGVPREDGPNVPGLSVKLVVLAPDSTAEYTKDVRVLGEWVILVGATPQAAYLLRQGGLFTHDFATGTEKRVLGPTPLLSQGGVVDMSAAGRLAILETRDRVCLLSTVDLTDGHRTARAQFACDLPGAVRLSPDGTFAAVSYATPAGEVRAAIVEVATGKIRVDRLVRPAQTTLTLYPASASMYGMAWADPRTLRVATAQLPEKPKRVYGVEEVLRVTTISTGPAATQPPRSPNR